MSANKKEFLQAGILILVITGLIFLLDLPKDLFINLAIIVPILVVIQILFPSKRKSSRKSDYLTGFLFLIIYVGIGIFVDLPSKYYIFIIVLVLSMMVIYEVFHLIEKKSKQDSNE